MRLSCSAGSSGALSMMRRSGDSPSWAKLVSYWTRFWQIAGISDVYIANVVKCRPPENRLPTREEVEACWPYLVRQIELLKPRIIVCLGALATQQLVHPQAKITMVHGKIYTKGGIKLVPTFHPAALLRDPSKKKPCWNDFKVIRAIYDSLKERGVAVG